MDIKNKLSVAIITLNEEKYIESCIKSVLKIADEIVIVDSGSVDRTVEISKKLGAVVYAREFTNYAEQKNYAVAQTTGNWILSLDGDEVIEESLLDEISEAINSDRYDAYSIPRKNIIFGQFIKHSRWQPNLDRHIWLFKKNKAKWQGAVHEEVIVNGRTGILKNAKVHYQYETVGEFFEMLNKYSEIESNERLGKGDKFSYLKLFIEPLYTFALRYIYRLGFLDGWRGFVLSYLMAIYQFEVIIKIWSLQTKK